MNGVLVGNLEKTPTGNLIFNYSQTWLDMPGARPISLSMPLTRQHYTGDIVYNFFDNLLPDNTLIRSRLQARFQAKTSQPFDLLENIGKDCVGAIQLLENIAETEPKKILYNPLSEKDIAFILRHINQYPLGMSEQLENFRISIAGAQEKTAFLYWNGGWNEPLGMTPTSHIFKLPLGVIQPQHLDLTDSCENEWLCSQILSAFGLPVAKSEILWFEDVKVLAVERFDRRLGIDQSWIMRLPQEDLCQALGTSPHLKYQADGGPGIASIMKFLMGASDPTRDRDLFFRSQILFWLLAAIDGHAKNFSIYIESNGEYQLTPLYDVMSAHPLIANKQLQEQKIKMAMALQGKRNHYHWHQMQRRYFLTTAEHVNYPKEQVERAIDEILEKVNSVIAHVSKQLPHNFPSHIAEAIFSGIHTAKKYLNIVQ
jgi:serine/threonine-protein kinase HipA